MIQFEKMRTSNSNGKRSVHLAMLVRSLQREKVRVRINLDVGDQKLFADFDLLPYFPLEVLIGHQRNGQQLVRAEEPVSGAWIQGTFDLAECKATFETGTQSGHLDRMLWDFLRGIDADTKAGKDLSGVILEAQPKLQAMLTTLIDELAHIGVSTGFLARGPSDHFDQNGRHIRTREIGWLIAELGRLLVIEWNGKRLNTEELMGGVIDTVKRQMGPTGSGTALSHAWADVGDWVA